MRKERIYSVIILFSASVLIVGGSFGLFYLWESDSAIMFFVVTVGLLLMVWGISYTLTSKRKRSRMSGSALAKEIILEQSNHLARKINKKSLKKNKLDEESKKLGEEIKCLSDTNDDLLKHFNKEEVKND